jgi:hypothetical protein
VVLCELEGLSRPEAARRLDIPEGTLSSRLSRAKAQLRDRLARRGVTVPAVVLASALLREAQAVSLPSSLIEATVEAATHVAAGASATAAISASVASLSEGVLKTMLFAKLKGISLGLGLMTAVVSSAVVLAQSGPGPQGPAPGGQPIKVEKAPEAPPSGADRTADLEKKLDRILDALDRLSRPIPPSEPDTVQPVPVTMLVEGGSQPPSPVPTIARARSQPQPLVEAKPEPDRDQDEIPSPQPEPSPKLEPQAYSVRPTSTPAPRSEAVVEFQYQAEVPKRVKRVRQNPVSITDRLNAVEERLEHFDEVVTQLRREVTELRKQVGGAGPQGGEAPVRNPTPSP